MKDKHGLEANSIPILLDWWLKGVTPHTQTAALEPEKPQTKKRLMLQNPPTIYPHNSSSEKTINIRAETLKYPTRYGEPHILTSTYSQTTTRHFNKSQTSHQTIYHETTLHNYRQ
jgi:hypothetical protein